VLLLIVGCVMDLTPALLILRHASADRRQVRPRPDLFRRGHDREPLHRLITPPVGNILFVACGISKISVADISRAIWPNVIIGSSSCSS